MGLAKTARKQAGGISGVEKAKISEQLLAMARSDTGATLKDLESNLNGLSAAEVGARVERYGWNEIAREKRRSLLLRLWDNVKNPLVLLLVALGTSSYLTGDLRATIV